MLNQEEVLGSTFPIPNPHKVRTDNIRPIAWMIFIFISSLFGIAISVDSLRQYQPPQNPIVNQFLLEEGTHRWVLRTNEQCEGYVIGGWKKRRGLGERTWFKFKFPGPAPLEVQYGEISAKFADYKNLESLKGNLNGKPISFDGINWVGLQPPTKELILMIDGPNRNKLLKMSAPLSREFDSYLGNFINRKRKFEEVDREQFQNCVKELRQ